MDAGTPLLIGVKIRQSRLMSFAGMGYDQPRCSREIEEAADRYNYALRVTNVLAELIDPTARFAEINLHVDHYHCDGRSA
jgi:hypothetical protein